MSTSIEHYNILAQEYDSLSKKHNWYSPEILFGLSFEFAKSGEKLLDIGIGTGQSSLPFKRIGLHINGLDGSEEMLKRCTEKEIADNLIKFDLNQIPFPYKDGSFDHIISNGVMYFFRNLGPYFSEASRILKIDGIFAFTVEDQICGDASEYVNKDNDYISERMPNKDGVKLYRHSQKYIEDLSDKYGFKILKKVKYRAYNSPIERKDIYFVAYVLKKLSK